MRSLACSAEKAIRKYVKGRGAVREWVKLRERNEALDLEVYSLAALHILGPAFVGALSERASKLAQPVSSETEAVTEPSSPVPPPLPADPFRHHRQRGSAWVRSALPPGRRWWG